MLERASHALCADGRVWVIDPVDGRDVEERIRSLGEPAAVVQLVDRHRRDSAELARRLGVAHHVTPFDGVPGAPFDVLKIVRIPRWHEVALWFREERTLVCGDALGTASYFRAPGDRVAVHPFLRLLPPRRLGTLEPLHVLVGHGEGIHGPEATAALREALGSSRRRAPAALASTVSRLFRGATRSR